MWIFLSLTSVAIVAVVGWMLHRYPMENVSLNVRIAMCCAWLTSISMITYIPVDVWAALHDESLKPIHVLWQITYWSTQFLTWIAIPLFMGYVDSGAFGTFARIRSSIRYNLIFYIILLSLSFVGVLFVISFGNQSLDALPGTCIALANMFGLTVVVFMLGYGLVSVPRTTWKYANPHKQLKLKQYDIGRTAMKVEESIVEIQRVHVMVHVSAKQISRRDPLRPYIDCIKTELMNGKPKGIEFEEGDDLEELIKTFTSRELDYALDKQGLTELRRRVRDSINRFEAARTEYAMDIVHAMDLHEICRRKKNGDYGAGYSGAWYSPIYWITLCILVPIFRRLAAILLAGISLVVIWCELIIIGNKTYLSPIYLLLDAVETKWTFYCYLLFPLAYMFFCTFHTLFNLAAFRFYHLIPKASSSYSLLLNGSLMCRFAAPLTYNFLHVIQIEDNGTEFSKVMGKMNVLPFLGDRFNTILPIFLLVHCIMITFNIWKRLGNRCIPARYQFYEEEANEEYFNNGEALLVREQAAKESGQQIGEVLGIRAFDEDGPSVSRLEYGNVPTSSRKLNFTLPVHVSKGGKSMEQDHKAEATSRLDSIFSSLTDERM